MNIVTYPLGHTTAELDRLDAQALLLRDPVLDKLAAKSESCLEIGCGNGSNIQLLRQINPYIRYTGIDIVPQAIRAAKARFGQDKNISFAVSDGASINIEARFDLIFTKLVLWSVGPQWQKILNEARRLLTPCGIFYALEPCNQLIQIYPAKPEASSWMKKWDAAALQRGLNPYIGIEVASALISAGYNNVETAFFPVMATGIHTLKYQSIMNNLKGFYFGPAADTFGLGADNNQDRFNAVTELETLAPENFVMDALFASWGSL